jgi:hypothetical protein
VRVIHFTSGATDPLREFRSRGARFVPLADGFGDTHVSCLQLVAGGRIPKLPLTQACALLIVRGDVVFTASMGSRLDLSAGTGLVMEAGGHCGLESRNGATLILVEVQLLEAHECGISTPQRIRGEGWPDEALPGGMRDPQDHANSGPMH